MKLILGGAQIADTYGVSNTKKGIIQRDLKKIFNHKNKIRYIDTANTYKNSLETLSKYYKKYNLNINLKIDIGKNLSYQKNFFLRINKSLIKLKTKKIYSIMIHDTKNFLKLNNKTKNYIYNGLKALKIQKKIKKFGFSIYTKNELSRLKKFKEFDIIQFPGNIFDQAILLDNSINFFKKRKVEMHARSIFLQGLIFLEFEKTKKITGVYSERLEKFFNKFKTKKERIYHCLNFIKNQRNIDKIIIGITSLNELQEIIKFLKIKLDKKDYSEFFIKNDKITKPYLWKKTKL